MEEHVSRKKDHIKICLEEDVEFKDKTTWFEYVEFIHNPLPEMNIDDVKLETKFLGECFNYPILIEGMTGGVPEAFEINKNLAEVSSKLNIPMEVGSQRAGIYDPSLVYTYRVARDVDPDIFLIGNIGGVQLAREGVELAEKAVEMIDADALAIHLNPLQELIQPKGTPIFRGVLKAIEKTIERLDVPVIVKEVGCGIPMETAKILESIGVKAIDVAGAGGTNWTLIEKIRARESQDIEREVLGEVFQEWGIPTAASLIEVASSVNIDVVASGGIRSGLDIAKSLSLGACMAGIARPLLRLAVKNPQHVLNYLKEIIMQIKVAMYLTGSSTIEELRNSKKIIIFGPLLEWCCQRNLKL
ncbi:MAG: type 2 isopentenyl-diphosphate Delta-isomerase [Nitrososphaerota archaeon]|nr:type 2 isopentenyl-diphosphate Delta-isomerase [Candidatus Geocrenenecus dongiae]